MTKLQQLVVKIFKLRPTFETELAEYIADLEVQVRLGESCDIAYYGGQLARQNQIKSEYCPYKVEGDAEDALMASWWNQGWRLQNYEIELQLAIIHLLKGGMITNEKLNELLGIGWDKLL